MKKQILYLFDPLCGWCYGFSETMLAFYKEHASDFEFVAVPGGMITGKRIAPYNTMEAYILNTYKRIEEMSGTAFGESYIRKIITSETLMDSEPPSRALLTFRSFHPDRAVEFAHELQKSHFIDGKLYDEALFKDLAINFQLDPKSFMERYQDLRMKQNVQQEFAWVKESGVQGFPTVVYRSENKYYMLAHGFTSLSQLNTSLEKAQKQI